MLQIYNKYTFYMYIYNFFLGVMYLTIHNMIQYMIGTNKRSTYDLIYVLTTMI